jgi:hypothetical protein
MPGTLNWIRQRSLCLSHYEQCRNYCMQPNWGRRDPHTLTEDQQYYLHSLFSPDDYQKIFILIQTSFRNIYPTDQDGKL